LPPPDHEAARKLGPVDGAVLDFVSGNERGLIVYGPGADSGRPTLWCEAAW